MNNFSIFDHIFDATIVLNQKSEIVYFNNQASIFFKLAPRVLKQKSNIIQLCESTDLDLEEWIHKALLSFDVLISPEINLIIPTVSETLYSVVLKLVPIELPGGSNFALFFQDKTVENQLHNKYRDQLEELKKTHTQILQADKLTTLGELTANISHEINNPLTIAGGHLEILKDLLHLSNPVEQISLLRSSCQTIQDSVERVNQIIRNMKEFLHKSEEQMEYCDLIELLDTATAWVKPTLEKANVVIKRSENSPRLVAMANKIKLEQVLINLMKNSVDAIKETGMSQGEITISMTKSDKMQETWINIIDNGPGLTDKVKENLFKPFTTTKEIGRGTGLGLSICAKIVESHKGKLELVESAVGCHFRLCLPLIELYSYSRNNRSLAVPQKHKRVLVLDNEVQILNVLNTFIQDEDMVFIGSSDPHDALDFLNKAAVDIIITDFSMPEMSGGEFSWKAREMGYTGPIFYMTSSKFVEQYNKDKNDLDIDGLIIKPFNRDDVMKTIRSSLKLEGGGK